MNWKLLGNDIFWVCMWILGIFVTVVLVIVIAYISNKIDSDTGKFMFVFSVVAIIASLLCISIYWPDIKNRYTK